MRETSQEQRKTQEKKRTQEEQESLKEVSYRKRSEGGIRQRKAHIHNLLMIAGACALFVMIVLGAKLWKMSSERSAKEEKTSSEKIVDSAAPKEEDNQNPGKDSEGEGKDTDKKDKKKNKKNEKEQKTSNIRTDLDPDKPMIALTFDDGPYNTVAKKILKVLKKNDARATFFYNGYRVDTYHEAVEKAYKQGCQIGSHGYSHKSLKSLKPGKIKQELERTNKVIKKYIGEEPTILRPPYGALEVNNDVKKVTRKMGMSMICWNVDSEDWKSKNAKKIKKRVNINTLHDGDIVLMHELYDATAKSIKEIVPRLKKKGYQMVTIEELFYYKNKRKEPKQGEIYYSGK